MEMAKPPGTQWVSPHTLSIHTYHRTQQSYSWARSQTNENICSHENLYVLHWKLETIQLSLSEESATQTVRAHPLEGNSKIETRGGLPIPERSWKEGKAGRQGRPRRLLTQQLQNPALDRVVVFYSFICIAVGRGLAGAMAHVWRTTFEEVDCGLSPFTLFQGRVSLASATRLQYSKLAGL